VSSASKFVLRNPSCVICVIVVTRGDGTDADPRARMQIAPAATNPRIAIGATYTEILWTDRFPHAVLMGRC
jgi:hypothetical protein